MDVDVRFRFNKRTGEVEEFVVEAGPDGLPEAEHNRLHDSDELLDMYRLPKSLAVVGAGVIGSEYACMFAAMGIRVHLIDGRESLLPFLDPDLSKALTAAMEQLGVTFWWKQSVTACDAPKVGEITLKLTSGEEVTADQVLVCAGRTSPTAALNPQTAGVGLTSRGLVPVDENFQTSAPGIYAASSAFLRELLAGQFISARRASPT